MCIQSRVAADETRNTTSYFHTPIASDHKLGIKLCKKMSGLEDIKDVIRNETALATFLKKVQDDQRSLEANTDNLFILLNAIIVYCKCTKFPCFNRKIDHL